MLITDTPTGFSASLEDTATTNAVVAGATANWRIMAVQFVFDPGPADDIVVFGRHRVGPHAGDMAPNPNVMAALFLDVIPGGAARFTSTSVDHPAIPHFDRLDLSYTPSAVGGSSLLNIRMEHTPLPPDAVRGDVGANLPDLDELFALVDGGAAPLAPGGRGFAGLSVEFSDGAELAEIVTEYAEAILRSRQQTRVKGKLTATWGSIKSRD